MQNPEAKYRVKTQNNEKVLVKKHYTFRKYIDFSGKHYHNILEKKIPLLKNLITNSLISLQTYLLRNLFSLIVRFEQSLSKDISR